MHSADVLPHYDDSNLVVKWPLSCLMISLGIVIMGVVHPSF